MKFRYPTDKEFEMAGRLYYFEHTHFFNVSPLHSELINDSNKTPSWRLFLFLGGYNMVTAYATQRKKPQN